MTCSQHLSSSIGKAYSYVYLDARYEPPRVWCTLPFEGRIDHDQEMEQEDKEEVIRLVLEHSHKYPS